MNLDQQKLTKAEWDSIELPLSEEEIHILTLINNGFHDPKISFNKNKCILSHLKMENNDSIEFFIYERFFKKQIEELILLYKSKKIILHAISSYKTTITKLKQKDKIRFENTKLTDADRASSSK